MYLSAPPQAPAQASEYFADFLGAAVAARPLVLGTARGVRMDLGILVASKNVHMAIGARALALDDLRLASRRALAQHENI